MKHKMNYLVFVDLDDTLINGQSQKLLIKYLFKNKNISFLFYFKVITWFLFYKIGLINNVQFIGEKFFKICNGWNIKDMHNILMNFFDSCIRNIIRKEFLEVIKYHNLNGGRIILLSATIYPLARIIVNFLNLHDCIATKLRINDDVYLGEIDGKIVYGLEKKEAVLKYIKFNKILLHNSYGYGDHFSDIDFLNLIDNVYIVNPNKKFEKVIRNKKWNTIFIK